jgi:hypothetical protein
MTMMKEKQRMLGVSSLLLSLGVLFVFLFGRFLSCAVFRKTERKQKRKVKRSQRSERSDFQRHKPVFLDIYRRMYK